MEVGKAGFGGMDRVKFTKNRWEVEEKKGGVTGVRRGMGGVREGKGRRRGEICC